MQHRRKHTSKVGSVLSSVSKLKQGGAVRWEYLTASSFSLYAHPVINQPVAAGLFVSGTLCYSSVQCKAVKPLAVLPGQVNEGSKSWNMLLSTISALFHCRLYQLPGCSGCMFYNSALHKQLRNVSGTVYH